MSAITRAAHTLSLELPERRESATSIEKVKWVFENIVDALIWTGYVLQHALYYLLTLNSDGEKVFQGRILTNTHNYGKLSELWSFVKLRRTQLPISAQIDRVAAAHGFTIERDSTLMTKPHSGGICTGGVTLFLKKWFETKNILEVSAHFEEGAPLEGALYQELYDSHFEDYYYPVLTVEIKRIIDANDPPSEIENENSPTGRLLQGVRAYKEEHNPVDGGMDIWVHNWVAQNFQINLTGQLFASLRKASSDYTQFNFSDIDRIIALHALADLNTEELHVNSGPGDILRTIPHLQPGAYKLALPCYGSLGNEKKSGHTIAFIVQEGGFSYFYDPNSCIACSNRDEVQATVGRLCTKYTGFDYSENLDGNSPSFLKKVSNFFREEANPPSTQITGGFHLMRITAQDL